MLNWKDSHKDLLVLKKHVIGLLEVGDWEVLSPHKKAQSAGSLFGFNENVRYVFLQSFELVQGLFNGFFIELTF